MLAFACVLVYLHGLGLGDVAGKDAAHCPSFCMDGQHDLGRQFAIQVKKHLKNFDNEIHGCVVIVEQNHLVHRRRLECGLSLLHSQASGVVVIKIGPILIEC